MESKAKFLGHPLHQQLIVFPLGLLGTAVIFDIISIPMAPNPPARLARKLNPATMMLMTPTAVRIPGRGLRSCGVTYSSGSTQSCDGGCDIAFIIPLAA